MTEEAGNSSSPGTARIGIIDYGMGNLGSVKNACDFIGMDAAIVQRPDQLAECRALILPGVGAFGDCMRHLTAHGFVEPIRDWIAADRPFMGICLGMQVLLEWGEESPDTPGLGVFPGTVRRFHAGSPALKVPQIGWNRVSQRQPQHPCFHGIPDGGHFYFVHSYYVDTPDAPLVAGETQYGVRYTSCLARGRLFATQFHPEKSQQLGLRILTNFKNMAEAAE
jgi:imidazole glycerol-phosphate synthase subunit HisH